ncbi:DUF305 domain-containing protein [Mycobacterium nebraskense]|uniref:DUF305 domain-containing protein n=1 Tax=Mycobacterium nebraskense TaxID=244292 RepID=UPI000617D4E9|nr:DUF305 domain-containing protein [Mycobacterium nebraskense]KKC02958.1 hypothetical protein WU83_21500 [Mycobacterium nebraskense]
MKSAKNLAVGVATVVALTAVGACSNSGTQQSSSSAPAPSTSTPGPAHNHADVTFAQQMIPHHQQAIEMSDIVLGKQGIDPRVVDLARQIKAAQGPEIEQMKGWLSQWQMPTMTPGTTMPGHSEMPSSGPMPSQSMMPGMNDTMSPADMAALQNAQGVDASKLFLSQMIKHHQGAIAMAQNEINTGQDPAGVALAKSIVATQQQQIDTMKQILASL